MVLLSITPSLKSSSDSFRYSQSRRVANRQKHLVAGWTQQLRPDKRTRRWQDGESGACREVATGCGTLTLTKIRVKFRQRPCIGLSPGNPAAIHEGLNIASTAGLTVGMSVSGPSIPGNATSHTTG